jgi:predicted Zn-dependent peptidase
VTKVGIEHQNVTEAIDIILREYKKLKTTILKPKELAKAKEYLKGRLLMGLEGTDEIVEFLAEQEAVKNRIRLPREVMRRIDEVTAPDVKRVANELFVKEQLNLALIGPHKEREAEFLDMLKI